MNGKDAKKVADTVLNIGERVWIKVFGIKWPFYLTPLRVDTMIYMSPYSALVSEMNKNSKSLFINTNAKPIAKYIAVSLLNKPWKIFLFTRLLSRSILGMLPSEQHLLLKNAESRYEVDSFFLSVILVQRANILLNGKEEWKEVKASSVKSESPKKSSTKEEVKSSE